MTIIDITAGLLRFITAGPTIAIGALTAAGIAGHLHVERNRRRRQYRRGGGGRWV